MVRATAAGLPATSSTISRSPPAENALPAPVTRATRAAGSASSVRHTWVSSQWSRALVAFSTSGRLMVIRTTPSASRSNRRWR
jgi:hypothetical protein